MACSTVSVSTQPIKRNRQELFREQRGEQQRSGEWMLVPVE